MTRRRDRLRWSGLTLRMRLTLTYGLTFILCGAGLLAVAYALTGHALENVMPSPAKVIAIAPPNPDGSVHLEDGRTVSADEYRRELAEDQSRRQEAADTYRTGVLNAVLTRGFLGLAVVTPVALLLCWVTAGRALRPLRRMTGTVRRIAETPAPVGLATRIDITGPHDEVRELAVAFDAMLAKLDASFAAQRRFVANAAHELRTPLAIDRTVLEVSLDGPDPDIAGVRQRLLATNYRQSQMLDGLLALARAEQATLPLEPVDLAPVVLCEVSAAEGRGIKVETAVMPAVVSGEPTLLALLVRNLIGNGVKYNVPDGWLRVELARSGPDVLFTVANSGPVVVDSDVELLFVPFRRGGTDRTNATGGSGLGLSIVRAVTHAHRGSVSAVADDAGGLTVEVRLPALDGTAPEGPQR
jgi:signal transduction histidine kinase